MQHISPGLINCDQVIVACYSITYEVRYEYPQLQTLFSGRAGALLYLHDLVYPRGRRAVNNLHFYETNLSPQTLAIIDPKRREPQEEEIIELTVVGNANAEAQERILSLFSPNANGLLKRKETPVHRTLRDKAILVENYHPDTWFRVKFAAFDTQLASKCLRVAITSQFWGLSGHLLVPEPISMVATALKRLRLQEESRGPTDEAGKAFYSSHEWDPLFMFKDLLRIVNKTKKYEQFAQEAPKVRCNMNREELEHAFSEEDYLAVQNWLRSRASPRTQRDSRERSCERVLGGWREYLKIDRSAESQSVIASNRTPALSSRRQIPFIAASRSHQ